MSTRRMTRETRVEVFDADGRWRPVAVYEVADFVCRGYRTRTVERMVTEWVEVAE